MAWLLSLMAALASAQLVIDAPVVAERQPAAAPPSQTERLYLVELRNGQAYEGDLMGMEDGLLTVRLPSVAGWHDVKLPWQHVTEIRRIDEQEQAAGALSGPRGVGWTTQTAAPDGHSTGGETFDPAAAAERINQATGGQTWREQRDVEAFNQGQSVRRQALQSRAQAQQLRTQANQGVRRPHERQALLHAADGFDQQAERLEQEARELMGE